MGSTTLAADITAVGNYLHQNGIPNGTHRPLHADADTSRMNIEECRLETFKGKWPVQAPVPAEKLAKAGFYYTGHDMEVTCFSCGGCIGEWNYNDSAIEKHKRFFGNVCHFVNNTSNNIPYTSQSKSKPKSFTGEFHPGSEKSANKPYVTNGPSFEAANVHPVAPGVGNNAFEKGQSHERNFPFQYQDLERLGVSGQLGESRPTQNGIPSVSRPTENINSNRMTFGGNSASGANLTYQENEAMYQPQENRAKGIFMRGNSGVGSRVMYNNHEVSRPTGQQQPMKGIFMSGNSGLGATVMYKEFNVNNPSTGESSSNSERNSSSSSSSSEDINVNGVHVQTQAVPSTREQFFNQPRNSTACMFPGTGTSTEPVHTSVSTRGVQVQAMPNSREQFFNQGTSSTPNIFPGTSSPPVHTKMNGYVGTGTPEEKMKYEAERLKSFKPNWPLTFISPYDLAKAGFYYLMRGDICRCAFCQGVLANWKVGDIPIREHHRNFPLCPFVMGLNVGNVPSYTGDVEMLRNNSSSGQDECGPHSYEILWNVPERSGSRILPSCRNADEEPGGIRHKGPMHVSQATIEARLRSFQSWPLWSPIKAERLAEAGFFYIGIRDHTKCFYCDIGLCNWEPGDDPWVEHGRWSKNCTFVMLLKGEDFVNSCQVIAASQSMEENVKYSEPEEGLPSPFNSAVDEAMRSSLVQNVLKTKVYPSVLIRKALLRKFQDTGRGVSNVNELSEAVMVELEESWRNTSMPTTEMQTPVVLSGSLTNGPVANTCNNLSINSGTVVKPETELTTEEKLEQVKQQSEENRLCKICMDREIEVAFIPCGHQLACRHCALALKDCAICRKPVERFLRIFLP